MINNVSNRLELLFPDNWTPNVITLLGNCALPLCVGLTIFMTGTKLTAEEKVDDRLLILCGFAVLWFSQFDIMDGLRARRQKSGSPLGRIIDEALD